MIAALGETTGYTALKRMHFRMLKDPVGQEILRYLYLPICSEKHFQNIVFRQIMYVLVVYIGLLLG
jgi:hypothetical protein